MSILNAAWTQVQVWTAFRQLHRQYEPARWNAVNALTAVGPAALPCLRFAIGPHQPPHVRFAAAVALHHLGDPRGLSTLTEALRMLPPDLPAMAAELTRAFVMIGAPDAVTALIEVFPHLEWRDTHVITCVCDVWAALRDPRALPVLIADGTRFPELFERTVPAFGEMAVPHLDRMSREGDTARSLLAIRTLRHIASPTSFVALRGLLRAAAPDVRSEACHALQIVSPEAAAHAVADAVKRGFSTRTAVELLIMSDPMVALSLSAIINRRAEQNAGPTGDTQDAVIASLNYFRTAPMVSDDLLPAVARIVARDPNPAIAAASAQLVASGPDVGARGAELMTAPLLARMTDVNSGLREACGMALQRFGDPIGIQLNASIERSMPAEGLVSRLQTLLRGGPDAGQVATQAVLQVSQWVTRISRETVERIAVGTRTDERQNSLDLRLPPLTTDLLRNAVIALSHASEPGATGDALALAIAAVRVLSRLPESDAQCARPELVRALHTVKHIRLRDWLAPEGQIRASRDAREVAEPLRTCAANLIARIEGPNSLPIFLQALTGNAESVTQTAISALGRLGDSRALPPLQLIANDPKHPQRATAMEAIAAIRRVNPEMMTLLRAAPTDSTGDALLRPAYDSGATAPDHLLRAVTSEANPAMLREESS